MASFVADVILWPSLKVCRLPRCCFAALLAFACVSVQADTVQLVGVRVGAQEGRTRLVLDLSAKVDYRLFRLSGPERLVLELRDTSMMVVRLSETFPGTAIAAVEYSQRGEKDLRIVVSLVEEGMRLRPFTLGPDATAGRSDRLVVDMLPASPALATVDEEPLQTVLVPADEAGPGAPAVDQKAFTVTDEVAAEKGSAGPEVMPETPAQANVPLATADDTFDDFFSMDGSQSKAPELSGFFETSAAYTVSEPEHWSKLRARLELALTGDLGSSVRYKLAARVDGDAAYLLEDDFYPSAVRNDQRLEAQIREFYLDFGSGSWAHRVGRQHIVWGEMVGLFLADVVSARDTREFVLQDFEAMRIPQWAWNTQYFAGDSTLELLYIPFQSVDNIGEPGADFYPFPVPGGTPVRDRRPERRLANANWGARVSTLVAGWSLSGYYYDSASVAPTLLVEESGLSLEYDDIQQFGATFSKDFGGFVFKGEAVYVRNRRFQSLDPEDPTALPESAALDWVVGSTIPLGDWRVDLQLYGRRTGDYDPRMGFDANEYGATVLINYALSSRIDMELLALSGLNREDTLLRPKFVWRFAQDWRLQTGADLFSGTEVGLFGPYADRDRVYLELKRWF